MAHEAEKAKWEYKLEKDRIKFADLKKDMLQQKNFFDLILLKKEEEIKRLQSELRNLQLQMEKQKFEGKNILAKKEEELTRFQLEASNLTKKMNYERAAYDQNISMKDREVAEARGRAELIRLEKDKMKENHERKIQEQVDYRLQNQKEARNEQRDLFLQWKSDSDKQHAASMQRELQFRQELNSAHTQSSELFQKLQTHALEHQTKQIEIISMALQKKYGSGPATDENTNTNSAAEIPVLVLHKPCVVLIDNLRQGEVLRSVKNDENILQDFFEHTPADVRPVLNGKTITRSARSCQREDYSENDGIMVFLFSYGNNMTLKDDSRKVDIGSILEFFAKNHSLVNKPKLFFVQAMQEIGEEKYKESKLYDGTDYLLCYCEMAEATYIKKADAREGSMFIKSLHDAFTGYGNCDIEEILEIVELSMIENIGADFSFQVENHLNALILM